MSDKPSRSHEDWLADMALVREESAEAFAALSAAGAVRPCPMCGTDGWHLMFPKAEAQIGSAFGPQSFDVYTLFCSNCGFVRQHMKGLLNRPRPGDKA